MKPVVVLAVLGLLIFTLAGSGAAGASNRAVLYVGHRMAFGSFPSPSDATARQDAKRNLRDWRTWASNYKGSLKRGEMSPDQFRRRLAAAAARYDFTVKRVEFVHARALAPVVIVQTRQYRALARAISKFFPSLCARGCMDVFFEAQDERGVPFIVLGQGQWARSD